MRRTNISAVLAGLILTAMAGAANATFIAVDTDPGTAGIQSTLTVAPSDTFSVDIVIGDLLNPALPLQGFEFDLTFGPEVTATGVARGAFLLGVPPVNPVVNAQTILGPGIVEFAEIILFPGGVLGSGAVATISFTANAGGVSALDLSNVILTAPFAVPIALNAINNATVTVQSQVPEPGTLFLLGAGLAALAGFRRRQTRA